MKPCPCGSGRIFIKCCKPYITGKMRPLTAEALMRSRYSAYTRGNIGYIQKTMREKALEGFDPADATNWAQMVTWLGLKVVQTQNGQATDEYGTVEFIATYRHNGQIMTLHECSEFNKQAGIWYYVGGRHQ